MKQWNSLRRLLGYVMHVKATVILVITSSVIAALLQIYAPYLLGEILNHMAPGEDMQIGFRILLLLLVYLLVFILSYVQEVGVAKISNKSMTRLREESFSHLTKLPVSYFDTRQRGDLINRLTNDMEKINQGLQQIFSQIFSGSIILICSVIAMFVINASIASIVLLLTPFIFIITSVIAKRSHHYFLEQSKISAELQGHAEEMIAGQRVLRIFSGEEKAIEKYEQINQELYRIGRNAQFSSSLTNPGTRFVNNVTYVLVGVVASALAAVGRLNIGNISALLNYALQYAKPINEITAVMTQVQEAIASADRVFALLDEAPEPDESEKPDLAELEGNFAFGEVSFSYVPEQKLLEEVSLAIEAKQTVAIVGPTGAGKTTIVNLLMRFYEPTNGGIYLDGKNIADYTRESLRSHFGMVLQDTWLFGGSIYDNIAYGKEGSTKEEVIEAAKRAHAHHFIMQLAEGYETRLGDLGGSLSTGQKQLLTIARVMLSQPEILILDEATSNIDTRTEVLVQESFLRLMQGRTSFIIAHRLSTIRNADLILVMDKGQIVEMGKHEELLKKKGFYHSLYHA